PVEDGFPQTVGDPQVAGLLSHGYPHGWTLPPRHWSRLCVTTVVPGHTDLLAMTCRRSPMEPVKQQVVPVRREIKKEARFSSTRPTVTESTCLRGFLRARRRGDRTAVESSGRHPQPRVPGVRPRR